jgi:phage baseplate assembly protein W
MSQLRYKDISLTFRNHPVTGDITKLFDDDAIKASVINLVMTMNYEIPFHPEVGCAVRESLFDNISPMTGIKIRRSIEDVLNNFEPRIKLLSVQVKVDPDSNGYMANIFYRIINQPEPVEITIFLEKKR